MNKDLSALRNEYAGKPLEEKLVHKNPMNQFSKWFDEASKSDIIDVNAMTLSTVSNNNLPKSRIVLLKGFDHDGFTFYTNYQSNKGQEIENNPVVALNFFWPQLSRQIRIEGKTSRVSNEVSEKYFQNRPKASQIGAWASPQSTIIDNRDILEQRQKKLQDKYKNEVVLPKPVQWGGYKVNPFLIEFWQGRPSRLHDRLVYTLDDNSNWQVNRLAP